jgi:glycosyltransferase involved in cell wall biosynthesis
MNEWIVIVTERNVWPPKHGCDARIVQLIKGYQKHGFKVCLVGTEHSTSSQASHLVDRYILTNGPSWDWEQNINTFDAGWFFGGLHKAMKELNRVVAVQVEYIWMVHALKVVPDGIVKLVDTHDLMHKRAEIYDPHNILPYCRISREREVEILNKADVIIAIQDEEAKEFKAMCPDREVITVGHWIDNIKAYSCDENSNIVMLVGSDNPSNVMGANQFMTKWHELRKAVPDIELRVYGTLGSKIPDAPGVVKYGFVQLLDRAYVTAKLVINPTTLGTGLKIKTVEAMAHGRAVVTTPCGAEGIRGGVCVSDSLVADIIRLLEDDDARRTLEHEATSYASENFSVQEVMREVVERIRHRTS